MKAIQLSATGGPEVMQIADVAAPEPGPDQVAVRVEAAGVNFIDTYHRSGLYPVSLPFTPGAEGAGFVEAVGRDVTDRSVGDRVAWATVSASYAEVAVLAASESVRVPDAVELDVAAATMLQGMTAHYLVTDTFALQPGHRCLIHAGAGGVGLILIQLAKRLGAEVFTTVGTAAKAELAREAGADHAILYRDIDFAAAVEEIAGARAIDVVYDGVGASTFQPSLGLLKSRGMMVTFGNASGPVEPVSPLALMPSLFLTRPSLFDYISTPTELNSRSDALFDAIAAGQLSIRIGHRFDLAEAAEAHRSLEGRTTTGKILLLP